MICSHFSPMRQLGVRTGTRTNLKQGASAFVAAPDENKPAILLAIP
jgi:hypothetical protein